jgi:hypothetical protein
MSLRIFFIYFYHLHRLRRGEAKQEGGKSILPLNYMISLSKLCAVWAYEWAIANGFRQACVKQKIRFFVKFLCCNCRHKGNSTYKKAPHLAGLKLQLKSCIK